LKYACVIVDVAHSAVDREFDYAIPEDYPVEVVPGLLVRVPFGPRRIQGYVVGTSNETKVPPGKIRLLGKPVLNEPVVLPQLMDLARWMRERYHCTLAEALHLLLPPGLRTGQLREKTHLGAFLALEKAEAQALLPSLEKRAPQQHKLLKLLLEDTPMPRLREQMENWLAPARALEKKGAVSVEIIHVERKPYSMIESGITPPPEATAAQKAAMEAIAAAMAADQGRFYLFGVTGSGKTEIYLRCAARAIESGRGAIILVPEIALTPQMVQRVRARFGDRAAVLHSRLSQGERFDQWQQIRRGRVDVVVGARSAVFAPLGKLGLIVVDEEHESSYRSEQSPRYDAVDVACRRCDAEGATLVLGSATPSVERYRQSLEGEYTLLRLDSRILGQAMPEVKIVDMRQELIHHNKSMFSSVLQREMRQCLYRQEQMILLLNRRGHSTFISCRRCGEAVACPNCDISLTYHSADAHLKCHYCGAHQEIPDICPACGSKDIRHFGAGTQRIEAELEKLLPGVPILRMDRDSMSKKDAHAKVMQDFASGDYPVLLGTQMVAKGLDFPNVTLIGVLAADTMLGYPDFRSGERTFQLIAQVAGRAGRDKKPGRVVVQTYNPDDPSVMLAAAHDYEGFYRWEIAQRRRGLFPPFSRFVRILFTDTDRRKAWENTESFYTGMKKVLSGDLKDALFFDRMPAMIGRIQGHYRFQVLVKLPEDEKTDDRIDRIWAFYRENRPAAGTCTMEINPQNMV
jgi:primosomal protein N' (replication factor Y)